MVLSLAMQFKTCSSFYFFALQFDHKADTDISLPVPITDIECKEGRSKRESLYVPGGDSQESEDDINYMCKVNP